jgi:hypothetical protein
MRKTLTALAAAATLATAAVSLPSDAQARWRGHHGGAVAAGVLGGLAAGAIVGSAFANPYYGSYYYDPGYYAYDPVYAAPGACYWQRQQVCDPYGYCRIRRVQVC